MKLRLLFKRFWKRRKTTTRKVTPAPSYPVPPVINQDSPVVVGLATSSRFSFNTDGSDFDKLSKSHQKQTATGIGNGGEILGYTIPLDRTLKKIKTLPNGEPVAKRNQAAILNFFYDGEVCRLLAVGNDTGGRHVGNDPKNRTWGEFGVNVYRVLQAWGLPIQIARNSLTTPENFEVSYTFLDEQIYTIDQYRALQQRLINQGRL